MDFADLVGFSHSSKALLKFSENVNRRPVSIDLYLSLAAFSCLSAQNWI